MQSQPKITKQEMLEKIKNCSERILALERDVNAHLYSKRHECRSLYDALRELDAKMHRERVAKKQELWQSVSQIKTNVCAFRRMTSNMKPDARFVQRLKEIMENIESSIMSLKKKERQIYESSVVEEQTITQEMAAFNRKLDSWTTAPKVIVDRPKHPSSNPATVSTMPPAVVALERFLQQTGGHQGGWETYDHQTFLKIRTAKRNQGGPSFLEAVALELPTKTPREIAQHEQWYVEYSTLLESKKKAIEQWREEKKIQKSTQINKPPVSAPSCSKRQSVLDKEKEERFSRLKEWKAQQEQKQLEAEEERIKLKQQESQQREKERKRRELIKGRVEVYVRSKEAEVNEQKMKEEAVKGQEMAQRQMANKEIEKFRERDMKTILEKKKMVESKEAEKLKRAQQLEHLKKQVKVSVEHNPARLFKLTAGWEERKKASTERDGPGISIPKRAVPSWRQGL